MTLHKAFWRMGVDGPQLGRCLKNAVVYSVPGRRFGGWVWMDPSWARPIHWQEGTGTGFTELRHFGLSDADNNALSDRVLPGIFPEPTAKE